MARQRTQPSTANVTSKPPAQLRLTRKRAREEAEFVNEDQQELVMPKPFKRFKEDDNVIKQFRDQIGKDQEELRKLLKERSQQMEQQEKRHREDIISVLGQALDTPSRTSSNSPPTDFRNARFVTNPLFKSVGRLNNSCQSLLSRYDSFEEKIAQMASEKKHSITDKWTRDVEETERLLAMGHRKAVRDVKKVLGFASEGDGGGDLKVDGFDRDESRDFELQKSLRYAERGVRRMVKGLLVNETNSQE